MSGTLHYRMGAWGHPSIFRAIPGFAVGITILLGLSTNLVGQGVKVQDPFQGRNKGKFSILRDAELSIRLAETRTLLSEGKRRAAVEALLAVLRAGPAFVDEAGTGSFVGLRESARLGLGSLDRKSRDVYQSMIRGELEAPVRDGLIRRDESALSDLASRFPFTDSGEAARLAAGDLALERGDFLTALQAYSLFDGQDLDSKVRFRKLLCRKLLDLPINWEKNRGLKAPDGASLEDWLERAFDRRFYGESRSYWPAYGGGLEGTRLQGDATRPDEMAWSRPLLGLGNIQYNMHAVTNGRKVFINTGTVVEGLDLWTGRGWQQRSPLLDHGERQKFADSTNFRHILSGALGQGILIAPLQVPIKTDEGSERISFRGIPITARLPVRRLFAFDAETGKLLWSHWGGAAEARARFKKEPLDTCGPPTIIGDTIYLPTHKLVGGISYYVSAFDLHSGELIWKTLLLSSQIEVNMFGNAQWEFSASPLAYADGVIYGCTNLGAAFSLRCDDGSIRWLREYEVTHQPRTKMYVEEREVYWGNNPPVVSDGVCVFTPLDSSYAIALDTRTGGLNWRIESFVRRADDLIDTPEVFWMLGAADGYVYFQGHVLTRVPIKAKRRRGLLRHELLVPPVLMGMQRRPDRKFIPRGVLTQDKIYVPVDRQSVAVFDHKGKRLQWKQPSAGQMIGNLLISKNILFSLSCPGSNSLQLDAYFSHTELLTRSRRRTVSDAASPEAWIDLSDLLISDPQIRDAGLEEAAKGFRKAMELLKAGGERPGLGLRARRGLFETLKRLAVISYPLDRRAAFAHFDACLDIGRELATDANGEKRLIQLMVDLLDRYPDKRNFRASLLNELAEDHADRRIIFPRLGRVPIGLFVILERLSDLPRTHSSAASRLALLRRMLLDYPTVLVDGIPARTIALERSRGLIESYGRDIYASIEKEARGLLEEASDDPGKLRQVLELYPLSDTARFALIHLTRSAAERGDLGTCLEAWNLARTRLEGIPKELPPALATASKKAGNQSLAAAFEALASGERPSLRHLALVNRLRTPDLVEMKSSLSRAVTRTRGGSSSLFLPQRVAGFPGSGEALPLLLNNEQGELLGFQPGKNGRGFSFEHPLFRLPYERLINYALHASIHGKILILPDAKEIRAYHLDTGRLLWSFPSRGAAAEIAPRAQIRASGPLHTGLYAWVTRTGSGESQSLTLKACEPLTGKRVFEVQLRGIGSYPDLEFREGSFFHLAANPESAGKRLSLRDGLTGEVSHRFDFDGTHLPQIDHPSKILFTDQEVFFMGSPDGSGQYRLYAFDLDGNKLWTSQDRTFRQRDTYRVLPNQVFLAARFGHNATEGRAYFLDRKTGETQRKVEIGFDARLTGQTSEAALHKEDSFVMTGRNQDGRTNLYYLHPDPGKSSWVAPLTWGARSTLAPGSPILGESFLCLARYKRRGERAVVDLHLFDRASGKELPGAPEPKGVPSTVEVAAWNGQLLIHGRFDHTWVYADKMGK